MLSVKSGTFWRWSGMFWRRSGTMRQRAGGLYLPPFSLFGKGLGDEGKLAKLECASRSKICGFLETALRTYTNSI
ncbi:MAG: hypothetical protein HC840_27540 [Leptolyngbyaceae cyanobacterium RM2_2_4]|nr:hypothetical protein [Leptolyngbyaceae cyanobacterium RM2_2_4]